MHAHFERPTTTFIIFRDFFRGHFSGGNFPWGEGGGGTFFRGEILREQFSRGLISQGHFFGHRLAEVIVTKDVISKD